MVASQARSLPLRQLEKQVMKYRRNQAVPVPELGPDEMQLYSYYRPGLSAGNYLIEVEQEIKATTDTASTQTIKVTNVRTGDLQKMAPQPFEVVVPRFKLDRDMINSHYPPDGHQDEGRILPHVTFKNPHFPWEINAGTTPNLSGAIDNNRNMVPWIALLVFDTDELRLDSADFGKLNLSPRFTVDQQNVQGTFSMLATEYFSRIPGSSQISFPADLKSSKDQTEIIFPSKRLVLDMFGQINKDGVREQIESLKYLAHVRNINTVGFPDAGIEENGLYSIVISSRTGRIDIDSPKTHICHLVSVENLDTTIEGLRSWITNPSAQGSDRIGMFSLFSWVYTALPPRPINFVDTIENLVRNQQMLRVNNRELAKLKQASEDINSGQAERDASKLLLDRLSLGYVPARWRAETGEETAAFNRGPLVPQPVSSPPTSDLPDCSNTSKEFQIYDPASGLMDLSYSSAWQLGKLLAISDTSFSAALMRFRSTLSNESASMTRKTLNKIDSEGTLLTQIGGSVSNVRKLARGETDVPVRLMVASTGQPAVDVKETPQTYQQYKNDVTSRTKSKTDAGSTPYNEFNDDLPNDTDWTIILKWVMDRLYLADIPPHSLFPDPSFVPSESLRYFFIDDFWFDCLIDGALSVANHLDGDDDLIRKQIKDRLNLYLSSVVPTKSKSSPQAPDEGIVPQVPGYGFILRSALIKVMPDLRITVEWKTKDPEHKQRQAVCRYTRYDDTTIICLLDRQPEELESIILAQPPHQQRFSLGSGLNKGNLLFTLKQLYTNPAAMPDKDWTNHPNSNKITPDIVRSWYNWGTRCMNLKLMAQQINSYLQDPSTIPPPTGPLPRYNDKTPNSCELALELNDPSYYFKIVPPTQSPPTSVAARNRQIFINKTTKAINANVAFSSDFGPGLAPIALPTAINALASSQTSAAVSSTAPSLASAGASVGAVASGSASVFFKRLLSPKVKVVIQPLPQRYLDARKIPTLPSPPNLLSLFNLGVYPDYAKYPPRWSVLGYDKTSYIPTKNLYFFDLIFSIRKKPQIISTSDQKLMHIQIDIPHAQKDSDGKIIVPKPENEPLLDPDYDGPGLRMTGNQRWIPFLFRSTDRLTVVLIPRTADDNASVIMDARNKLDLGFRLAEANVGEILAPRNVLIKDEGVKPRGEVTITMIETYYTPLGNNTWPITTQFKVLKNAVRDQADIDYDK